jgi:hypothetical protein
MPSTQDEFREHFGFPGRSEVLDRLRGVVSEVDWMSLLNGSTRSVYNMAQRHGVITDEEYRDAARQMGSHWHLAE